MFPAFQSYLLLIPCVRAHCFYIYGLPRWLGGKESACNAGDVGLIPGSGRSSGGGNGNPLQHICPLILGHSSAPRTALMSSLWGVQAPPHPWHSSGRWSIHNIKRLHNLRVAVRKIMMKVNQGSSFCQSTSLRKATDLEQTKPSLVTRLKVDW